MVEFSSLYIYTAPSICQREARFRIQTGWSTCSCFTTHSGNKSSLQKQSPSSLRSGIYTALAIFAETFLSWCIYMLFAVAEVLSPAMISLRRLIRYTLSTSDFCKFSVLWSSIGVTERSELRECQSVCLGRSFLQTRRYQEIATGIKPARITQ